MKRLTEREEEIMNFLWDNGPMYVRNMLDLYPDPKPHFNTISTFVRILEQKGMVDHERTGNSYRYFAKISRDEYSRQSLRGLMSKYFNNSVTRLTSALASDEVVTDEELKEILDIVRNVEKDKKS